MKSSSEPRFDTTGPPLALRGLMHKQVHPGGAMGSQRPRGRQPKGALYVIETVLDLPKVDPKIGQKLARDGSEVPPDTPKLIRGRIVGSGKPH